jgi:hypothetical protein
VVHVIVALVEVTPVALTDEITGGPPAESVLKVELPEAPVGAETFVESAAK